MKNRLVGVVLVLLLLTLVVVGVRMFPDADVTSDPGLPGAGEAAAPSAAAFVPEENHAAFSRKPSRVAVTDPATGGARFVLARDVVWLADDSGDGGGIVKPVKEAPGGDFEAALALGAKPVMHPADEPRTERNRRLLTNRVTVKLAGGADPAAMAAAAGADGFETPEYAPGHAVFFAGDELSAPALAARLASLPGASSAEVQLARLHSKRAMPNDPLVNNQWHLNNTSGTRTHLNVEPAWAYGGSGGVRGSGIRIGIVDDGIQTAHPDFTGSIDTDNDKDWNGNDNDPNPGSGDDHGTSVAGVAAARGNNNLGVAGVAPEATLVGLRLTADYVNDSQEAEAMAWKNDIIQVKNNSWGPDDAPDNLEGPGSLTQAALANATATGRGGLGTIFVWAAGNGGDVNDNSNYDGYANSIHTIAVGATDSSGNRAYYSEQGANVVVCAPSDGASLGITTTDRTGSSGYNSSSSTAGGDYTDDFGGTSSATPAAAGVVALMLERNPLLGWRDVQEILIRSAYKVKTGDFGWATNGGGLAFHDDFGAGLVDADAAVDMAATWANLAPQETAASTQSPLAVAIPNNTTDGITQSFHFGATTLRVEHVTVRLNISHSARGNLEITLASPSGMTSRLARVRSDPGDNYSDWTFSSVRHWGEISTGTWSLTIADRSSVGNSAGGTLTFAEVKLYGTPAAPLNQRPSIAAATLNAGSQAFADETLEVVSVTATDPEDDPFTLGYQWQSSTDGESYLDETGAVSASLAAAPSRAGRLWRCVVTASDTGGSGTPFTSSAVNILTRPPTSVLQGAAFSHASGLVLRENASSPPTTARQVIINEFSHGPPGGTAEWIELLTLQSGSLAYWDLQDSNGDLLVFQDSAVWDNIPAGTLIVIYNGGTTKDPLLPPDDFDPTDGTMVVSSTNTTYFDPEYDSWLPLGNNGDSIFLNDEQSNNIHQIAYGNSSAATPNIGSVGPTQAARFIGGDETSATQAASWETVPATVNQTANPSQTGVTPAAPNTPANASFVASLRPGVGGPALFRTGAGASLPEGLALDENTGVLSGTIAAAATPGTYPIIIERYNSFGESITEAFTLQVVASDAYSTWIAQHPGVGAMTGRLDDADGDGLANAIENVLGFRPDRANARALTVAPSQPGQLKVRHERSNSIAPDVTHDYQWSTDLVHWHASGATNAGGVRVDLLVTTITDNAAPDNDLVEVTATAASGASERLFLRLRAW